MGPRATIRPPQGRRQAPADPNLPTVLDLRSIPFRIDKCSDGRMPARARRVFVIDDDHSVRRGLARLLTAAGFRVETFESGAVFLKRSPPRGEHCLVVD